MGQSPAVPRAAGALRETAPGIQAHRKAGDPKYLDFLLFLGLREAKEAEPLQKKRGQGLAEMQPLPAAWSWLSKTGEACSEPGIVFCSLGNPKKLVLPPSFLFSPNWFVNINKVVSCSLTLGGFFYPWKTSRLPPTAPLPLFPSAKLHTCLQPQGFKINIVFVTFLSPFPLSTALLATEANCGFMEEN